MKKLVCTLFAFSVLSGGTELLSQMGTSSGSMSMNRHKSAVSSASMSMNRAHSILTPSEVLIEDYINYHQHNILRPGPGEPVAMDVRWGNPELSSSEKSAVLQVGFATHSFTDRGQTKDVNLCIVLDHSGSMEADNRLELCKQGIEVFLKQMRPNDMISVVIYDDVADVLIQPQLMAACSDPMAQIRNVHPDGGTNIEAGLLLGFDQVMKNHSDKYTNRVLLLTDGQANLGEVIQKKISENVELLKQGRGIEISTIGVGNNVDFGMLSGLAKSGRGLCHFIGGGGLTKEDITKVFEKEAQSLLTLVAENVTAKVRYSGGLHLKQFYGYDPVHDETTNTLTVPLMNMSTGVTQILMLEFEPGMSQYNPLQSVEVELTFKDAETGEVTVISEKRTLNIGSTSGGSSLLDPEVRRNYVIAQMASSMKDFAVCMEKGDRKCAEEELKDCISWSKSTLPAGFDADVERVHKILDQYLKEVQAIAAP